MTAAIVTNNIVTNMIYILEQNLPEFPNAIDPTPWGLMVGDYTTDDGETWYRDIEGVATQLPLPIEEPDTEDMQAALELLGVEPTEVENNG